MSLEDFVKICNIIAERLQRENNDVEIKFNNQKDLWFSLTCQYYDNKNDDYINLSSKVDVDQNQKAEEIENIVSIEIKNLLEKKKRLEENK
ncbi:MAG: hypothetical protein KGH94_03950 [Candidatus Micrarchaeota archaeon]|nr:hypothetical protein [Candidatus Micrarchaeota archaeon]